MRVVQLAGRRFGRLLVVDVSTNRASAHKMWNCVCDCGAKTVVRGTSLTQKAVSSCGCLIKERGAADLLVHGHYYHSSYATWRRLMTRCQNENCEDYKEYGRRGIDVCQRWQEVGNFIADMGSVQV